MSRKRARTSQHGPGIAATTTSGGPSLDTNPFQLDSNAPYCGFTNTSTCGPNFKARRTSAGRLPIKIPETSPNIRVYEPLEFLQQSGAFSSPGLSHNTPRRDNFRSDGIPSSSLELPSPFSVSPTTTVSEGFTNTTPSTSVPMSREDSLATSFCGAFNMVRANSGVSEVDSGQNMRRQDSSYGAPANPFSPNDQVVGTPLDPSIYFAHAEGTAIEDYSTSMPTTDQLQLPTGLELDADMKTDIPSSYSPDTEQAQALSSLDHHTKMIRDASSESNSSSTSRLSRRSQEQIVQAARPIAPKDVAESPVRKTSSSSLSGGQEMRRQRSAPESKILIPKLQYNRQAKEKLKCDRCNKNPDGYRGSHELQRHMALDHNALRTAWVCVDISSDGFLSGCSACESEKPYGQDYNAAAHLRRFHFHPKSEVRRTNVDPEKRRGGKGGGKHPPMSECRRWMKKIKVPGKDYMALADPPVDDDCEDETNAIEELEEQDDIEADLVLPDDVQTNGEDCQLQDAAGSQQVSTSSLEGSDSLELATANHQQYAFATGDIPFRQYGLERAFETSSGILFDSNAASFTLPSTSLTYPLPTLSSSAPAAPSFLSINSAHPGHAHNEFAHSNSGPFDLPSTVSTTLNARIMEDLSDFQTSYIPDNLSYGMPSPNNPQGAYGLLNFPPFR